jgi:hypothetical protein
MLRHLRIIALLCLTLSLVLSCSSQRFYNKVEGRGQIRGYPTVKWVKPERFVYDQNLNRGFEFRRANGEIIRPQAILTDGGSIPRQLWDKKGFSPWTYAPAYLVHDWLYEAHRRKIPAGVNARGAPIYYNREQADWIMAEVIKSQMENSTNYDTPKAPGRLAAIYWAVNRFGKKAWNQEAQIVPEVLLMPLRPLKPLVDNPLVDGTMNNLPLLPALSTIKSEIITGTPDQPKQLEGTTQPTP